MFRTRDFILIFTTIAFLLVAIGATVLSKRSSETVITNPLQLVDTGDREYSAEIYEPETVSREERLADMREKIAARGELTISAPPPTEEDETAEEEEPLSDEEELVTGVQLCPGYTEFSGFWPTSWVKFEVTEGARIVYHELETAPESFPASATTSTLLPESQRVVLMQLPEAPFLNPGSTCLSSDVIGVAHDGSLIRNTEAGLYGVFGSGTLIGYALDGLPIYGVGDVTPDECGGAFVSGQYGYYLSAERETIVNCFVASPISL